MESSRLFPIPTVRILTLAGLAIASRAMPVLAAESADLSDLSE